MRDGTKECTAAEERHSIATQVEGVTVFLDGVFAPRVPTNTAAERELAGSDWRATVAIRSGVLAWW